MFLPNTKCILIKEGPVDKYGQKAEGTRTTARMAIINMTVSKDKTSVRADSSASRGKADEQIAKCRFLFDKFTDIDIGDIIVIHGRKFRTLSVFPRYDVVGKLDHYQVDAEAWA